MEITLGLIAIGALVYYFVVFRKAANWNADPRQQQIARMLIHAAETQSAREEVEIMNFMIDQGWRKSEIKNRIVHAVSITKVSSIPSVHAAVRDAGFRIHSTIDQAL